MAKSTTRSAAQKPRKPRPDFPLFPHGSGRWCKKVRGKFCYFGKVDGDADGKKALALWLDQKDALLAGKTPRKKSGDELTLKALCNHFLTAKKRLCDAREITPRTFTEYHGTCERLIEHFGANRIVDPDELTSDDFGEYRAKLRETRGPVALGNEIVRARMVFRFADEKPLIPRPIRFGKSFSKPSAKVYKLAKAEAGPKMFKAEELRTVLADLEERDRILYAIVLLSCNAAFGQNDIALVPESAFDLNGGWVEFPRPKTGVERRAKLWSETVEALRKAFAERPAPASAKHRKLAFLTPSGKPWLRHTTTQDEEKKERWQSRTDALGKVFKATLTRLKIGGRRGFYGIRHSFQTASDRALDGVASKYVMGHTDESISAKYRGQAPEDDRLERVSVVVHQWLFGN